MGHARNVQGQGPGVPGQPKAGVDPLHHAGHGLARKVGVQCCAAQARRTQRNIGRQAGQQGAHRLAQGRRWALGGGPVAGLAVVHQGTGQCGWPCDGRAGLALGGGRGARGGLCGGSVRLLGRRRSLRDRGVNSGTLVAWSGLFGRRIARGGGGHLLASGALLSLRIVRDSLSSRRGSRHRLLTSCSLKKAAQRAPHKRVRRRGTHTRPLARKQHSLRPAQGVGSRFHGTQQAVWRRITTG